MVKNLFLWLVIAIVLVSVFSNFGPRHAAAEKIAYSQFLTEIDQGMIHSVQPKNHGDAPRDYEYVSDRVIKLRSNQQKRR